MDIGLRTLVLLVPGVLALWTAAQCQRQIRVPAFRAEARVWAGISGLIFLIVLARLVRELGYVSGFGNFLRHMVKQQGWYDDRRMLQIVVSIAVVTVSVAGLIYGLIWIWHNVRRNRLAVGLVGLVVGFGVVRFVSLHEVDGWYASAPWFGPVLDSAAAVGISLIAVLRLRRLTSSRHLR